MRVVLLPMDEKDDEDVVDGEDDEDPDRAGFFQLPKNWGVEAVPKPDLLEDDDDAELLDEEGEDVVDGEDDEIDEDDIARMNAEIEAAERRSGEAWESTKLSDFDIAVDEWLVSGMMLQPPMLIILCGCSLLCLDL